jgi:hypothetical protein
MGLISLLAWGANFRRSRTVADTPTSRVASAPQGYVELFGTAKMHPGHSLASPVSQRPCVWYRYIIEERQSNNKWRRIGGGMSGDTFLLVDDTGHALVDPDCAEITTTDKRTWHQDRRRYTEWLLTPGGHLYAIGEFSTEGGSGSALDAGGDTNALLAAWKRDKVELLERFDLDGNGEIDMREWQLARQAAKREIAKQHQEVRAQPGLHIMRRPRDGRLFLLANMDPHRLARRYRFWTVFQLIIALGSASGMAAVLLLYPIR